MVEVVEVVVEEQVGVQKRPLGMFFVCMWGLLVPVVYQRMGRCGRSL